MTVPSFPSTCAHSSWNLGSHEPPSLGSLQGSQQDTPVGRLPWCRVGGVEGSGSAPWGALVCAREAAVASGPHSTRVSGVWLVGGAAREEGPVKAKRWSPSQAPDQLLLIPPRLCEVMGGWGALTGTSELPPSDSGHWLPVPAQRPALRDVPSSLLLRGHRPCTGSPVTQTVCARGCLSRDPGPAFSRVQLRATAPPPTPRDASPTPTPGSCSGGVPPTPSEGHTYSLSMKTVQAAHPTLTLSGSIAFLGQRHQVTLGSDLDRPHPFLGLGFLERWKKGLV